MPAKKYTVQRCGSGFNWFDVCTLEGDYLEIKHQVEEMARHMKQRHRLLDGKNVCFVATPSRLIPNA